MLPYKPPFPRFPVGISLLVASTAIAQIWRSDPFIPPEIPLIVKSPYLQAWLDGSLNLGSTLFRADEVRTYLDSLSCPPGLTGGFVLVSMRFRGRLGWTKTSLLGWGVVLGRPKKR